MLVHSVVEVDNNLRIDNRLESETRIRYKDDIGVTSSKIISGYVEPYDPLKLSELTVSKLNVKENDVIICKFDPQINPSDIELAKQLLNSEFPDNKVLLIANDIDLLSQNPQEAIGMLEKMIAHIKIVNV